ncbi:hypothetical protein AAZX31_13G220100 [Glycine max]|nr:hypothetical protein JHK87_037069 [Glycine soja]KAH1217970.1 hypothetical protein GmHk_13G038499 [Glycine max]
MKKDIRSCCYNEGSTSTHNKQNNTCKVSSLALQDLMLQFELEAKLSDDFSGIMMNDSNILRSTRKALNQYPRLSLDGGRDAMNRSSFGNIQGRRSVCCDRRLKGGLIEENNDLGSKLRFGEGMSLPHTLAGESVVWCKPGVVARLMGLEAIPLPVSSIRSDNKEKILSVFRMQNPRRRFREA